MFRRQRSSDGANWTIELRRVSCYWPSGLKGPGQIRTARTANGSGGPGLALAVVGLLAQAGLAGPDAGGPASGGRPRCLLGLRVPP